MNTKIAGDITHTCIQNLLLTVLLLAIFPILLALTGCSAGLAPGAGPLTPQAPTGQIGYVHGGQQPVSGSAITLWRVNTDGTAATPMLTSTVTTASDGTFSITGKYSTASCSATTQVYIMATGGNPGVGSNNSALALMAALGSCTALPSVPNISINEVSTVAAVYALQQFMGVSEGTPFAENIAVNSTSGLSAQSATGMINAFATVPNLVSLNTGTANTTLGNATMEEANLNTIANIISYCVNSTGGSPCTSLFSAVTPSGSITPGDTIQAALYIAQNPANNVSNIYALQPATPPFLPDLSSAPFDFSLAITYTGSGLNLPNLLASDASGNIWVTDNAGTSGSQLVELTPKGTAASGSPFMANGAAFDGPQAVLPDTLGNIWISANSSSSSTGNRLIAYNPTTTAVAKYSNLPSGCQPYSVAIDGHDDVFFACSKLGYLYEFVNSTSGTPSSGNPPSYSSSPTTVAPTKLGALDIADSGNESYGMAVDALGDVWVANTITGPSSNPTLTEYAAGSYSTVANTVTLSSGPVGIGIDSSNNVWAVNSGNLELQTYNSGTSYTSSVYTGGGLKSANYLAIDGRGYIWAVNRNVPSINATSYITISEYNNSGLAITPGLTTTEPGGLATVTTVTDASPRGIAIDPSGNVWIAGCGTSSSCSSGSTSFVMEYIGFASPPVLPLATAQASHQLGCCSFAPVAPTGTTPTNTAGNVSLQTPAGSFTQNNGQFSFEVTRAGGFNGALTVTYSILAGTAVSGTDYTCTTCSSGNTGTLTWANGDTSYKTISLNWNDTANYSGTKTFTISLSCTSACPAGFSPNQSEAVTVTDNLAPPSTHFSVFSNATDNFYLGLPIDIYGGTGGANGAQFGAQSITNSTLANGFSDPYFYLNGSQIVFTAPSNGATTSPGVGTNDTRSELREQYYGAGAIDTMDWDSAIGGTLNATCAVNQVSADTDEATIGQIHGQNQPFALLEYKPTSSTQGNLVLSVLSTNSTNSSSNIYTLYTGMSLNTFFSYQLKFSGSTLTASVTGGSTQTVTVDSSWVGTCGGSSCPNGDDGMYFKLGAYSGAPNTANPTGDQTQVTFSSFSVTHP